MALLPAVIHPLIIIPNISNTCKLLLTGVSIPPRYTCISGGETNEPASILDCCNREGIDSVGKRRPRYIRISVGENKAGAFQFGLEGFKVEVL